MQGTAGTSVGDHYADRGGRWPQRELLGAPLVVELSVMRWGSAGALAVLTSERRSAYLRWQSTPRQQGGFKWTSLGKPRWTLTGTTKRIEQVPSHFRIGSGHKREQNWKPGLRSCVGSPREVPQKRGATSNAVESRLDVWKRFARDTSTTPEGKLSVRFAKRSLKRMWSPRRQRFRPLSVRTSSPWWIRKPRVGRWQTPGPALEPFPTSAVECCTNGTGHMFGIGLLGAAGLLVSWVVRGPPGTLKWRCSPPNETRGHCRGWCYQRSSGKGVSAARSLFAASVWALGDGGRSLAA